MSEETNVQEIGDLRIDIEGYRLWKRGKPIELTGREWQLLSVLVRNRGRTMEGEMLIQLVWGDDYGGEERLLREYIRRLRCKLGDNPKAPRYLWTVLGLGYRFEVVSKR